MSSGPATVITLTTRRRPWWAWWLIRWARWIYELTGALVVRLER